MKLVLTALLCFALTASTAHAAEGRYLIVPDGQHGGVWKIDTLTGTVWRCTGEALQCFVVK